MDVAISILVVLVAFAGLGLTMINLPGNLIIIIAAISYGLYDGFRHFNGYMLLILVVLYVSGELFEFFISFKKLKSAAASKRASFAAFLGAVCGGIVGTGIIPVVGSLAGAMTGAFAFSFLAEYSKTKDAEKAKLVAYSIVKGQVIALTFKVSIAVVMVITIITGLPWHNG